MIDIDALSEADKEKILYNIDLELARRDFWEYCKLVDKSFYTDDKVYLQEMCDTLVDFTQSDDHILIVNLPPRFGKTRTITHFCNWLYGRDKSTKILSGSYNTIVSTEFSKTVRNNIQQEQYDNNDRIVFSNVFPDIRIKRGDSAKNKWTLDGGYSSYLATSPDGTVTSFGGDYIIIDDLIKNSAEAFNDNILEDHWRWFNDTLLSRVEGSPKIIIVFTRWSTRDLCGKILENMEEFGWNVKVFKREAINPDGTMLCDSILSRENYKFKTIGMDKSIADANYLQRPREVRGRLYKGFKTYTDLPRDDHGKLYYDKIIAYIDTADEGDDYLCCIIVAQYKTIAYVLDVIYTQDSNEITETKVAKALVKCKTNEAIIESNSGGRGFARAVERILRQDYNNNTCKIRTMHQSKNKKSRILSNSTAIMEDIIMPRGWENIYPEYSSAMMSYKKEGKNMHDDAPDATTGVWETINGKTGKVKTVKGRI